MGRTVQDAKLESPTARARLKPRHEPYWKGIDGGRHLGYRKGRKRASWVARIRTSEGRYRKTVLGLADDGPEKDGLVVLSWSQAQAKARDWFVEQTKGNRDKPAPDYSVADAIADYLSWYKAHGKAYRDVELRAQAFILPKLGSVRVRDLRAREITNWHRGLAATAPRKRTRMGEDQQYRKFDADNPNAQRKRKASANKVLTIVKAALNRAWREDLVESDEGWRKVSPFKGVDEPLIRHLSSAERTRLINASDPDFRRLVLAALLTGCRSQRLALKCDSR